MKTSHLLPLIVAVAATGCAYVPTWIGGSGTSLPAWMGGAPPSSALTPYSETERLSQNLGARVRSNIARANSKGIDTKLALDFQIRGDGALQAGRYTEAAEQYGRAEQALVTSEEIAQAQLNQREAALAKRQAELKAQAARGSSTPSTAVAAAGATTAPPPHRHVSTAYRARTMAQQVRKEIAQAGAQRADLSKAKAAQQAGDQALDEKNYGDALKAYRRARQELSAASGAASAPGPGSNPGP